MITVMVDSPLRPPRPVEAGLEPVPDAVAGDRRAAADGRRLGRRLRAAMVGRVVRERRLGRVLDRQLGAVAVVLHGRRTPADHIIDHLVVAATGVWVIEARHDRGRVVRRRARGGRVEGWLATRDGRRLDLVDGPTDRVDVVRSVVERMGFGWLDVNRVVCLTNAGGRALRRPFRLDGVWVGRGRALVTTIAVPGALGPEDMRAVAIELSARLPPAGRERRTTVGAG